MRTSIIYIMKIDNIGGFNMKFKKAFIIPVVCTTLITGAAVGFAISQNPSVRNIEQAEAASSSSYTMTAREMFAGMSSHYNDTAELVDGNIRVTSTVAGQFNITLQNADTTNMGKLVRNATSLTLSMKISAASEMNKSVICRYKDTSAANNWIYSSMNLNDAEAGFVDVTFNKPEDLAYFEIPTFQSTVVGAYVDIRSCTFNGLTSFVNASYTAIASGWNHGGYGGNAVLLTFNQTLGSAASTTNVAAQIADKVTINGVAIADISGGKISYDHSNGYFWIHYSADSILATVEYPTTILEVKDGTLFESAILNGVKLAFDTSSNIWVDDDIILNDLVMNSDYTLFTVDSSTMAGNGTFPYYTPASVSQFTDHNFGVQFNVVANTDSRNHFYIRFGSALALNDYLEICIDPSINNNLYISHFNGGGMVNASVKSFSMVTGQNYKIEAYSIKDSETTVSVILAINGKMKFNMQAMSIADPVASGFFCIMQGTADDTSNTFSPCATTDAEAIERFGKRALHTEDIPFSDNSETGACSAYLAPAKTYYTNYLYKATKLAFIGDAAYAQLKARLVAWGAANSEQITFNAWTGEIEVAALASPAAIIAKDNNVYLVIILVSIVTVSTLGAFLLLKKRKHN